MIKRTLLALTLSLGCTIASAGTYNDAVAAYHEGRIAEAVQAFFDLAVNNDPDAQYVLGTLFDKGEQVQQDMPQALRWYREAAERGNPFAQASLAGHLIDGEHVLRDYARALELFLAAAEQGHPQSQFNAAVMLEQGIGADADDNAARALYEKAANQGHLKAQLNLGLSWAKDAFDRQALTNAYKWLSMITSEHQELYETSRQALNDVSRRMTAPQLAEARQAASRFQEDKLMVAAPESKRLTPEPVAHIEPATQAELAPEPAPELEQLGQPELERQDEPELGQLGQPDLMNLTADLSVAFDPTAMEPVAFDPTTIELVAPEAD